MNLKLMNKIVQHVLERRRVMQRNTVRVNEGHFICIEKYSINHIVCIIYYKLSMSGNVLFSAASQLDNVSASNHLYL